MASTMTKATRSVKKLEVPRPLKSSTSQSNRNSVIDTKINSLENVIELTEAVACQLSAGDYDRAIQTNIPTMCSNLKLFGAQAELMYTDFLDRYFVVFRNASLDDKLDKHSRTHLLELIELRAKQWHTNDYMSLYYRHQATNVEPLLVPTDDVGGGTGIIDGGVPNSAPIEGPALLAPGELIKPSGKFPKPTKIPGKNYSKDEVVIRNADSGKVMGIKGRRVHMIEQLSDTIISFQRVSPGAKERLVQITGPNEENVNHAKHLIGDVIRRNASPVRVESAAEATANSADLEDEQPIKERSPHSVRSLHHSLSTNDAAIGVYKHTVTYGALSLKITGDNLEFVKTAKLVLDEHFNSCMGGSGAGEGEGSGDFFTLLQHPELAPLNGQEDDVFAPPPLPHHHHTHPDTTYGAGEATADVGVSGRRARFSRASSTDKNSQGGCGGARRTYSVEMLVQLGRSPLSRAAPLALSTFPPELARKVARDWDGDTFLQRVRVSGLVSQDAPDSPEPE